MSYTLMSVPHTNTPTGIEKPIWLTKNNSNSMILSCSCCTDEKREQQTAIFIPHNLATIWQSFKYFKFLLCFCLHVGIIWDCNVYWPDRLIFHGAVDNFWSTEDDSLVILYVTFPWVLYYYCAAVFHGPWKKNSIEVGLSSRQKLWGLIFMNHTWTNADF